MQTGYLRPCFDVTATHRRVRPPETTHPLACTFKPMHSVKSKIMLIDFRRKIKPLIDARIVESMVTTQGFTDSMEQIARVAGISHAEFRVMARNCRSSVVPVNLGAFKVREMQSRIALESRRHGPGWCE